jgi:hypothetical protein
VSVPLGLDIGAELLASALAGLKALSVVVGDGLAAGIGSWSGAAGHGGPFGF